MNEMREDWTSLDRPFTALPRGETAMSLEKNIQKENTSLRQRKRKEGQEERQRGVFSNCYNQ